MSKEDSRRTWQITVLRSQQTHAVCPETFHPAPHRVLPAVPPFFPFPALCRCMPAHACPSLLSYKDSKAFLN
jgi:hypothetical protein